MFFISQLSFAEVIRKMQYEKEDDDYYKYETTTCTFLNRDANGNYTFIHKSFMEYFLAENYFYRIRNKRKRILEPSRLNKETEFFLKLQFLMDSTQAPTTR